VKQAMIAQHVSTKNNDESFNFDLVAETVAKQILEIM
jgi:hypothetical protein